MTTHEEAPDARCISQPDGSCVSDDCMHTDKPADIWQEMNGLWWYHRDEFEHTHGPFNSRAEAEEALKIYVENL